MPRYNLNQDDIEIIVEALNKRADISWLPKEQDRIRRLISRLQNKINTINENVTTTNSIHLDTAESKTITLEPLDSLWAVATAAGQDLGVLIVRQSQ